MIYVQGVPKNVTNSKISTPKFSAVGQNYTLDVGHDLEALLVSVRYDQKNIFQAQGVPASGD